MYPNEKSLLNFEEGPPPYFPPDLGSQSAANAPRYWNDSFRSNQIVFNMICYLVVLNSKRNINLKSLISETFNWFGQKSVKLATNSSYDSYLIVLNSNTFFYNFKIFLNLGWLHRQTRTPHREVLRFRRRRPTTGPIFRSFREFPPISQRMIYLRTEKKTTRWLESLK